MKKIKQKKKVIKAWGIYDDEIGLVHYQTTTEVCFFRTKKLVEREMKRVNKGNRIVRVEIIINLK